MTSHSSVDKHLLELTQWQAEISTLRDILQETALTEDFKWNNPCYTYNGKNVAMIGGFKAHCFISFFKGVLLSDPNNSLQKAGENAQSAKLYTFQHIAEIVDQKDLIKAFVAEAIEHEKLGNKPETSAKDNLELLPELVDFLASNPDLKTAFNALTPGRQRGYNLYFSGAKQSATRISRIKKYIPRIMQGKGFHDCVCGHSKRMPTCDGSHKYL